MAELDLGSYGITVPASYRAMSAAGILSYGASREDWQANWKTLLLTAPPALSWIDLEWLTADEIAAEANANKGRASWRRKWTDFPFVPFAHSGAGDDLGWAPSLAEDGAEPPVVYIEHDSSEASIVAPTFAGFVFRKSLEGLARIEHRSGDEEDGDEEVERESLDDKIASVVASVRRVLPYLDPAQVKSLERTLRSPLRENVAYRCAPVNGKLARAGSADFRRYGFGFEMGAYQEARALLQYKRFDEKLPYDVPPK